MYLKQLPAILLLFFAVHVSAQKSNTDTAITSLNRQVVALKQRVFALENTIKYLHEDSDGDGVSDQFDKCPNTPPGTIVDGSGCPIDFPKMERVGAEAPSAADFSRQSVYRQRPPKKQDVKKPASFSTAAVDTKPVTNAAKPASQSDKQKLQEVVFTPPVQTDEKRYSSDTLNKRYEQDDLKQIEYNNDRWQKVFGLQYIMSIVIFIMVIIIVMAGLYLSYKQFEFTHEMLRQQQNSKKAIITQGADATTTIIDTSSTSKAETDIEVSGSTNFEISKDGIKINSAVIGLIILAMSIAFFFLYLEFVYPIHQI